MCPRTVRPGLTLRRPLLTLIAAASVALAPSLSAHAENPRSNTETFRPSPHASDLFATITSDVPDAWSWTAALWLSYGNEPLVFVDLAEVAPDFAAIEHQLALHATGALAFTDWLSVGLEVPLFLVNDGDDAGFAPTTPIPSSTLGDIRLSAKVGIVRRAGDADGFGLALELPVGLPTGAQNAFVSDGFAFAPALALDVRFDRLRVALNLGARLRSSETLALGTDIGNEALFRVAASFDLVPATLTLLGEVQGASHNFELSNNTYIEGLLGGRLTFASGLLLTLAGGRGFASGYGSTAAKVVAQLGWSPPPPPIIVDSDGDGLFDDVDACIREPEDKDGFDDDDGCPDPDNDGDGVLDADDRCSALNEDIDGFEDDDGCADPDNDRDGIPDLVDGPDGALSPGSAILAGACRNIAEDFDKWQDEDGCPEPDNDGDGILDANDNCANDPTNACGILVNPCEIVVDQTIYFAYDEATILPQSFAILDAVAGLLQTRDAIKLIEVQGHTDSEGDNGYNLALSQRRAESVVAYFGGKSIAASRFVAKGYGETQPLAKNSSADGRAKNRRVQFIIIDPAQSGCGR